MFFCHPRNKESHLKNNAVTVKLKKQSDFYLITTFTKIKLIMKTTYFTFILGVLFSVAFGQTKSTNYNFKNNISETLFDTDTTKVIDVYSLQKLGKTAWNDSFDKEKINLSPKKFSWYTDSKRIESLKDMISNIPRQDICGRDVPVTDIHSEVIQNVYFKSMYDR